MLGSTDFHILPRPAAESTDQTALRDNASRLNGRLPETSLIRDKELALRDHDRLHGLGFRVRSRLIWWQHAKKSHNVAHSTNPLSCAFGLKTGATANFRHEGGDPRLHASAVQRSSKLSGKLTRCCSHINHAGNLSSKG